MDCVKTPKITVVICTFNRAEVLQECLASFTNQTAESSLFEVLVINNNSSDDTQKMAEQFAQSYNNFRVLIEENQGLSCARNRGYKQAKGEWVAYVDDDARATNGYIERLAYIVEQYKFDCVGGPCTPLYHQRKPKWCKDYYYQISDKTVNSIGLIETMYIAGYNFVINKNALTSLGGFNTSIGMSGRKIAYGEETRVQVDLRLSGGKIYFDPELIVLHYIANYKLNMVWFLKSSFANGRDSWQTIHLHPTVFKLGKAVLSLPYHLIRLTFSKGIALATQKDFYIQNFVVEVISPLSNIFGTLVSGVKILAMGNQ